MEMPFHHGAFGFRIQYWGVDEQSWLIYGSLLPILRPLYAGEAITRVWYDRYNLGGPHISLVVGTDDKDKDKVKLDIQSALEQYVRRKPSTRLLSLDELTRLHRDSVKGSETSDDVRFVSNNSIQSYDIPLVDCVYPFNLCPLGVSREVVAVWSSISLLSMEHLKFSASSYVDSLALQVMFLIDEIVFTTREEALHYWLYHASTLLKTSNLLYSKLMTALSQIVTPEHQRISRLLEGQMRQSNLPPPANVDLPTSALDIIEQFSPVIRRLSHAINHENVPSYPMLREIVHVFLKQLGIATVRQIPLITLLIAADGRLCHTSEG
jgi:hypothetical protein